MFSRATGLSGGSLWRGFGVWFVGCGPGAVGLGDHSVAVLMEVVVVPVAQQHQVVEIGRSAVEPVDDVVRVAAGRRLRAAGPSTVSVACDEQSAQPFRHGSASPAGVG